MDPYTNDSHLVINNLIVFNEILKDISSQLRCAIAWDVFQ
jgi:hypothetical protein